MRVQKIGNKNVCQLKIKVLGCKLHNIVTKYSNDGIKVRHNLGNSRIPSKFILNVLNLQNFVTNG